MKYAADDTADEKLKKVLYDVLDTPVSPELLPPKDGDIAQKTEDLVGPYELHDFFLYYMLRFGYEPSKIFRLAELTFKGEYDNVTILKWLETFCRRFFSQQFKRSCLPDSPKIGTVGAFPERRLEDAQRRLRFRLAERPGKCFAAGKGIDLKGEVKMKLIRTEDAVGSVLCHDITQIIRE